MPLQSSWHHHHWCPDYHRWLAHLVILIFRLAIMIALSPQSNFIYNDTFDTNLYPHFITCKKEPNIFYINIFAKSNCCHIFYLLFSNLNFLQSHVREKYLLFFLIFNFYTLFWLCVSLHFVLCLANGQYVSMYLIKPLTVSIWSNAKNVLMPLTVCQKRMKTERSSWRLSDATFPVS